MQKAIQELQLHSQIPVDNRAELHQLQAVLATGISGFRDRLF
jgi:hypothetical protein